MDTSGAPVPTVAITVHNEGTGEERATMMLPKPAGLAATGGIRCSSGPNETPKRLRILVVSEVPLRCIPTTQTIRGAAQLLAAVDENCGS